MILPYFSGACVAMVYDVIDLDEKKSDTPEKLAIKVEPLGNSPALQMDVCVLREVSSKLLFLCMAAPTSL